jgi:biopolymer transport protein TolQ
MTTELSLYALTANATLFMKLMLLLLVLASIVSWSMIIRKWLFFNRATAIADQFEERFWSGGDLAEMYARIAHKKSEATGIELIFAAGFHEFSRMRKEPGIDAASMMDATGRAMHVALAREIDQMEIHLPFLATVGSTSPYIGLLGTVWGVMSSFISLGGQKHLTLATVAPGIAEALISTAVGLFAAIPAVIAYNRFAARSERLVSRYEIFVEEFLSILRRQARKIASANTVPVSNQNANSVATSSAAEHPAG